MQAPFLTNIVNDTGNRSLLITGNGNICCDSLTGNGMTGKDVACKGGSHLAIAPQKVRVDLGGRGEVIDTIRRDGGITTFREIPLRQALILHSSPW